MWERREVLGAETHELDGGGRILPLRRASSEGQEDEDRREREDAGACRRHRAC